MRTLPTSSASSTARVVVALTGTILVGAQMEGADRLCVKWLNRAFQNYKKLILHRLDIAAPLVGDPPGATPTTKKITPKHKN